jgi:hypothetical protein
MVFVGLGLLVGDQVLRDVDVANQYIRAAFVAGIAFGTTAGTPAQHSTFSGRTVR